MFISNQKHTYTFQFENHNYRGKTYEEAKRWYNSFSYDGFSPFISVFKTSLSGVYETKIPYQQDGNRFIIEGDRYTVHVEVFLRGAIVYAITHKNHMVYKSNCERYENPYSLYVFISRFVS